MHNSTRLHKKPKRPAESLRIGHCPTCGRPCVRVRGRDHCLRCGELPLLDRERREVRK